MAKSRKLPYCFCRMATCKPNDPARERGAVLVEMALVGLLFLLFSLALIDVFRYLVVRSMLLRGTQDGLNVAQKLTDLALDIRFVDSTSSTYQDFLFARDSAIDAAISVPLRSVVSPPGSGGAHVLRQLQNRDVLSDGVMPLNVSALLLRPGEMAIDEETNRVIVHPTLCPKGLNCSQPSIQDTDLWTNVLERHPFVMELQAEMPLFLGFFRVRMPIVVYSAGYRELPTTVSP